VSTVSLTSSKPAGLKVDALVVGVAKDPDAKGGHGITLAPGSEEVDKAFKGRLAATLAALGATGKADEVTKVASLGAVSAPVVAAVGLGEAPKGSGRRAGATYAHEVLRRAAGAAARALAGTADVGLALPAADETEVAAVAEGALLGAYTYTRYRTATAAAQKAPVEKFTLVASSPRDRAVKAAVTRAAAVVDAVNLTRDWVNTPPGDLPPAELAALATAAAKQAGLTVEVLDEKALKKGGYGGIMGVGQGSSRPPRLVRVSYKAGRGKPSLALVGKGITFDSGGLSLKPAAAMEWMKSDMGGAAAVLAAVVAIARLGLDVNVTAWAPMAENMPSGTAQRPSDVLTTYGGKTVEVLNTDAEGRLVLADALVRAGEETPDVLVDVATLTGAQLVALGNRTAAIMANDDDLRTAIGAAADAAGELMWPMPLPVELRASMDSPVADIANMGDKYGGMLVAGLFLKDFVKEGQRWAHLDIAGPSWNAGTAHDYTPKGGTGHGVRTLVRLAEDLARGAV
jgi:leucyl aminopeptidase